MNVNKISLNDFSFRCVGYGRYKVVYTSPVTKKSWSKTTTDMPLIDRTLHSEEVKQKDLLILKRLCKSE